jgi:hypothetical protein
MPPDVVCRITQSQPPLRTRASHRFYHNLNLSPQRTSPPGCAGFQPACRGARAFSSHAGGAGFQLACRERGRLARIQRCAPSPLHRLGARASSPHTAIHPITPAPSGYASVAPACRRAQALRLLLLPWLRERRARMPGARASHLLLLPWERGCLARMPDTRASRSHAGCAGVSPACSDAPHQRAGRPHPEARVFPQV